MPGNDREHNFEKALAGSLRSSNAAPGNDCLDAETLAAYHDRLLDPEEMAQRKAHIASCERCQEILAQLEATDGIAVEADRDLLLDQIVLELPETEPTSGAKQPPPPPEAAAEAAVTPATAPQPEQPVEAGADVQHESEFILDPKLLHDPALVPASAPAPSSEPSRAVAAAPIAVAAPKSTPASSQTITFRSPREQRPRMVRFVAIAGVLAAALILWFFYRDQSKQSEIALNSPASKIELPPQSPVPAQQPESESKNKMEQRHRLKSLSPKTRRRKLKAQPLHPPLSRRSPNLLRHNRVPIPSPTRSPTRRKPSTLQKPFKKNRDVMLPARSRNNRTMPPRRPRQLGYPPAIS